MRQAFHPNPIPPYPSQPYPTISTNMDYSRAPEIARTYAGLSPDADCQRNLDIWLADNGSSLESFYNWVQSRLNSDSWELPSHQFANDDFFWLYEIDSPSDYSYLNNLHALG